MSDSKVVDKIQNNINVIGGPEGFFVDVCEDPRSFEDIYQVGGKPVQNFKLLMGYLTWLDNRNMLLLGNPGTGKTTYAAVLSSVCSGLPYDLFDNFKIQGHPEQTKETMLARLDLSKLQQTGEEDVIWHAAVYLPSMTIDEINRMPPGKQAILLEYVRTGCIEAYGDYFDRKKTPFFATINYNGEGTYPLPEAALDRFDISLEFVPGPAGAQEAINEAYEMIEKLKDPQTTRDIRKYLTQKDISVDKKLKYLQEKRKEGIKKLKEFNIDPLLHDEEEEFRQLVKKKQWTADATCFIRSIYSESNISKQYGWVKPEDVQRYTNPSEHDKPFACSKIKSVSGHRSWDAIKYYSAALAVVLKDNEVTIDHIQAVAPFVLAHRIVYADDYKIQHSEKCRKYGECEQIDLTRRLVGEMKKNYDDVASKIKLLDSYLTGNLDSSRYSEVQKIIKGPEPDHPYFCKLYYHAKQTWNNKHNTPASSPERSIQTIRNHRDEQEW